MNYVRKQKNFVRKSFLKNPLSHLNIENVMKFEYTPSDN